MRFNIKLLFFVSYSLILIGCKNNKLNESVIQVLNKEIALPQHSELYKDGEVVNLESLDTGYKIIILSNDAECSICDIVKLQDWYEKTLEIGAKCEVVFITNNNIDRHIKSVISSDRSNVYIMITDREILLDLLNKLQPFTVFLLDEKGKVVLTGNPLHNNKLWELYKNVINGNLDNIN